MRNPKPKMITPEEEAALKDFERDITRAQILQYGVQKQLEAEEYCDCLEVCASVLLEAADLRKNALNRRAAVFADQPVNRPTTRMRRRRGYP